MAQKPIKEIRVSSSNIKTIAYDIDTKTLFITFINRPTWRYSYFHVPPKVWTKFLNADSKGKYFSDYVKDQYTYTRRTTK